jgi:hypothetical protein
MTMRYDDKIHHGDVLNVTRHFCIPLWSKKTKRTTTLFENGIEKDTETTWKFHEITCMP